MTVREKKEKKGERNREKQKERKRERIFLVFMLAYCIKTTLCLHFYQRQISSDAKVRKTICQYADFAARER